MDGPWLTAERGLLFRITHVANVPWILDHGLHCQAGSIRDPMFVPIGNPRVISDRADVRVRHRVGGCLSDYIPFSFVPRTPMSLNIKTGRDVTQRENEEIAILVSSIRSVRAAQCTLLFTDRHAKLATAAFSDNDEDLAKLPWQAFNAYDFRRRPDAPEAFEVHQAEALVKHHLPVSALLGIGSATEMANSRMSALIASRGVAAKPVCRPDWFVP